MPYVFALLKLYWNSLCSFLRGNFFQRPDRVQKKRWIRFAHKFYARFARPWSKLSSVALLGKFQTNANTAIVIRGKIARVFIVGSSLVDTRSVQTCFCLDKINSQRFRLEHQKKHWIWSKSVKKIIFSLKNKFTSAI